MCLRVLSDPTGWHISGHDLPPAAALNFLTHQTHRQAMMRK
jgi:hypothetical protein